MKKIICFFLICFTCILPVSADGLHETEAEQLNVLGLFRGTDDGYRLEKSFTRAEGATMLVRLLGKEEEALNNFATKAPFEDINGHWAEPYIAYCYHNGITNGTSATSFSPENEISAQEYVALVLRSLGYEYVQPENADIAATEYSLTDRKTILTIFSSDSFLRDEMVFLSYQALMVRSTTGETLIERLIASNVVSESAAKRMDLLPKNQYLS